MLKEDPSNQGYSRVSTQDPGTLSSSTTSTSLDVDQSADGSKSQKPRPFTPILESDDTSSSSFVEGFKELALSERAKRQKTTAKNSSRASLEEEEEDDKFEADPEAFQKNREHFQNKKSKSEHKSLILRVRLINLKSFYRRLNSKCFPGPQHIFDCWSKRSLFSTKKTVFTGRQVNKSTTKFT